MIAVILIKFKKCTLQPMIGLASREDVFSAALLPTRTQKSNFETISNSIRISIEPHRQMDGAFSRKSIRVENFESP